jgi:2-polyprenyl-3-methyl-5-hydroxy-6-metoxy-1,4-benzoquinol methylase
MESIKCIFCEKESDRTAIEENGYTGRKCSQCGLIYVSPRPSLEEIVDLYARDSAHKPAAAHISAEIPQRIHARHNLRIVTSFATKGALLEIGPGAGYFLDEARKLGFDPYGIELNHTLARFIRDGLNIPCEDSPLTSSAFQGKAFDVVYHCDVISHFFEPILEFRKMNDVMKENGVLVFETGNLAEVDRKYFKYFQRFQYPYHLFFFGTDNLLDLLERSGFELLRIYRYSILPQLMVRKALVGMRGFLFKRGKRYSAERSREENRSRDLSRSVRKHSRARKPAGFAWRSLSYLLHLLRYRIGYIAPKASRPQTVILVARKRRGDSLLTTRS